VSNNRILTLALLSLSFIGLSRPSVANGEDRYCGLYSVYSSAMALDHHIEFDSLVSPEFVSGFQGSTLKDVEKAVEFAGLRCSIYKHLSIAILRKVEHPVILHTRSDGQVSRFNHWLVLLGFDEDKCRVADGKSGVYDIPIAELMSKWGGVGVVVYKPDDPPSRTAGQHQQSRYLVMIMGISFGVFALTFGNFYKLNANGKNRTVSLLVVSMVAGICFHCFSSSGFLNNRDVLTKIVRNSSLRRFSKISIEDIKGSELGEYVLIDARYEGDTRNQMLPNSSNIPVDASDVQIAKLASKLPKPKKGYVVYCQSTDCSFDDSVANRLHSLGFKDVYLMDGGWNEWFQLTQQ
jgi:rhodanese-related sulfurtransferase